MKNFYDNDPKKIKEFIDKNNIKDIVDKIVSIVKDHYPNDRIEYRLSYEMCGYDKMKRCANIPPILEMILIVNNIINEQLFDALVDLELKIDDIIDEHQMKDIISFSFDWLSIKKEDCLFG